MERTVLLVDDAQGSLETLHDTITECGLSLTPSNSPDECIEHVKEPSTRAILISGNHPSAKDLLEVLAAMSLPPAIRVIVVCPEPASESTESELLRAGASAILTLTGEESEDNKHLKRLLSPPPPPAPKPGVDHTPEPQKSDDAPQETSQDLLLPEGTPIPKPILTEKRKSGPPPPAPSAIPPESSTTEASVRVKWQLSPKQLKNLRTAVPLLFLCAPLLFSYWYFNNPLKVRVQEIHSARVPLRTEVLARTVTIVRDVWLRPKSSGTVKDVKTAVPSKVKKGDVLVEFTLPDAIMEKHADLLDALGKTTGERDKRREALSQNQEAIRKLTADPKDSKQKKRLSKSSRRKLKTLKKKSKRLTSGLKRSNKSIRKAQTKLSKIEKKLSGINMTAPFDGLVMDLNDPPEGKVTPRDKIIRLLDLSEVTVQFPAGTLPESSPGDDVLVGFSSHQFATGKVIRSPRSAKKRLTVKVKDPSAKIGQFEPADLYLFEHFLPVAFRVPKEALQKDSAGHPFVFVVRDNIAEKIPLEVLVDDGDDVFVKPTEATLNPDDKVIISAHHTQRTQSLEPGNDMEIIANPAPSTP